MVLQVTSISKKVIDGSDENVQLFLKFLGGENVELTPQLRKGAYDYILSVVYSGSQGNVENINNMLELSDEKELRARLKDWGQMEAALWDVTDD